MSQEQLNASFRDPSGHMFRRNGVLYRLVSSAYRNHYDLMMSSGLYKALVQKKLLVPHTEVTLEGMGDQTYKVLKPEEIPYVSYPYEWSFSQLKQAALLTLAIQRVSLEHGMVLKDASAFNVQFVGSKPVFIDSLSFETYEEGAPWIAYKQYCQHFLGPLALMSQVDLRLQHLLKSYIDGIPLDLVSHLLPLRTRLRYSLVAHIHLHARSQMQHRNAGSSGAKSGAELSKYMLQALGTSLESAVKKLELGDVETEWGDYYEDTNYDSTAMAEKETVVRELLKQHVDGSPYIHDVGANTGRFSHIAREFASYVVSHDIDPMAVEKHVRSLADQQNQQVLPLTLDLTNPTPSIGWSNSERMSFSERVSGSVVLALAVVHHLAISNNVPLRSISQAFAEWADDLLIEFVPKSDSQLQRMLSTREDIFHDYTMVGFESAFESEFTVLSKVAIHGTERTLYYMRRRTPK